MIGEKSYCGLDIGLGRIKAAVVRKKGRVKFELLGVEEAPTTGLKKAGVSDVAEFSECISRTLKSLSRKSGLKIKDVNVGIGGSLVQSRFSRAVIPLIERSNKVVTPTDMKKINKQARLLGIKMDEEILHDFPQYYILDEGNKVLDPKGMYGRKLGVASLLIVSPVNLIANLIKVVNQAGYEVAETYFSSLASSFVTLSDEMSRKGSLLIDVGASTTNILFFKEGLLRYLDILPHGGDHLTENIAEAIQLPFDMAEEVKKTHAVVSNEDIKSSAEILVKKDDHYIHIKKKIVCDATEPQILKLLESIQNSLTFSHLQEKLQGGIVMVGGGSLLTGLIERVEKATRLPVELGKNHLLKTSLPQTPIFTSAVGLTQGKQFLTFGKMVSANPSKHWLAGFSDRIKELYEEYF